MVGTQAINNDNEQRRKRVTVEKAKAVNLSKQLQMRLQYARLKVEHGWQRQSLNEVENLYFHHSAMKSRPKPSPPSDTQPPLTAPTPTPDAVPMSEDTETPQELIDINMFPPPKEMSAPPTPVLPSPPSAPTHSPSHNPAPSPPQSVPTPDVPIKPAESPAELSRQPSLTAAAMSAFVVPTPALSRTTSLDLSVPSAFAPSLPGSFSFTSASASFTTTSTTFSSSPFATPSSSFTSAPQPSPFAPSPFAPAAAEAYVTAPMPFRPTKTFDIPTAPTPPSSQSNAATPAPLTYDSFWNTHSTASGWRRTVGTGSGAATPIAGGAAKG